jgi:hypothetical protein
VLFSERIAPHTPPKRGRARDLYIYDAWGKPRTWLKGEYAYLAPNAASLLLRDAI